MIKPVIKTIGAFDYAKATKDNPKYIRFDFAGTEQPAYSILTVYDAESLSVVYQRRHNGTSGTVPITSEKMEDTQETSNPLLMESKIKNGYQYSATIVCYNSKNERISDESNKMNFWCLETPQFIFNDIVSGQTWSSSSLNAKVDFISKPASDGRTQNLLEYNFKLYDADQYLLFTSDTKYTSPIEYTYTSLEYGKSYHVQCVGVTDKGIEVDTGLIKLIVDYLAPSTYARMYTTVDNRTGVVNYQTNFKLIEPNVDQSQYELEDGCVNLIDKTLTYDQEFLIQGDFTIGIKVKNPSGTILECSNELAGFNVKVLPTSDRTFRFKLTVPTGIDNYIIYSDEFDKSEDEFFVIWVRRINDIYGLYTSDAFINFADSNYWYARSFPQGSNLEENDVYTEYDTNTLRISSDELELYYQTDEPEAAQKWALWFGDKDLGGED